MVEIAYDRDSFNRCNCGGCPVQLDSPCIQELEEKLAPQKERIQKEGAMPDAGEMPGIYCASAVGKSPCGDLDDGRTCLCPACPLAIMEGLASSYYCLKGSAVQVG